MDELVFASATFSAPYMLPEAGIACQSKLRLRGIAAIGNEGPEMTDESNRTWSSLIQIGERFTVGVCVKFLSVHTRTPYWDTNKVPN